MKPGDAVNEYLKRVYTTKLNDNRVLNLFRKFFFLTTEREKWNFINDVKNSASTKTRITYLKNTFDDLETEQKRIAKIPNYR